MQQGDERKGTNIIAIIFVTLSEKIQISVRVARIRQTYPNTHVLSRYSESP